MIYRFARHRTAVAFAAILFSFTLGAAVIEFALLPLYAAERARETVQFTATIREVDHSLASSTGNPKVEESALPIEAVRIYPERRLDRPVLVTHAGDGSGRLFVLGQKGKIWIMPSDPQSNDEPIEFLDMSERVRYSDRENEEGLLGLAFHPKFAENGQFFVYYTPRDRRTRELRRFSKISRFTVSKDEPNKADAASEEEIISIEQPYWNHNGGTIIFGPDGYLYVGLGDGGAANDPHGHGQNLGTLLGSILRIDVDNKDEGKNYAVPKDNPFVDREGALPEIWAYGLRNVWRMAFDPATGKLWAGDVGQNLWEEINIIERGGNYGWNLREGFHPFGPNGSGPREDLIEPIWEYHHDVGKSITGGHVYRGKKLPELQGCYLFADYVSGRLWALRYDDENKKIEAVHTLGGDGMPIMSFGEDEAGEAYMTDSFGQIYTFEAKERE